jgi:hypothetical protein
VFYAILYHVYTNLHEKNLYKFFIYIAIEANNFLNFLNFYFSHLNILVFFLQLTGIAMGTSCGPAVANLHLVYYEIRFLHNINVSLYHRFIDDNIFVSENILTNKDFENIYPGLELEIQQADEVNFLEN